MDVIIAYTAQYADPTTTLSMSSASPLACMLVKPRRYFALHQLKMSRTLSEIERKPFSVRLGRGSKWHTYREHYPHTKMPMRSVTKWTSENLCLSGSKQLNILIKARKHHLTVQYLRTTETKYQVQKICVISLYKVAGVPSMDIHEGLILSRLIEEYYEMQHQIFPSQ
jgi:hypothetical protein